MSSLKVEALHREFFYNGTRIPDPAPNLTVEQVRELLSYPEIATATLAGPEDTGDALRYTFNRRPLHRRPRGVPLLGHHHPLADLDYQGSQGGRI